MLSLALDEERLMGGVSMNKNQNAGSILVTILIMVLIGLISYIVYIA